MFSGKFNSVLVVLLLLLWVSVSVYICFGDLSAIGDTVSPLNTVNSLKNYNELITSNLCIAKMDPELFEFYVSCKNHKFVIYTLLLLQRNTVCRTTTSIITTYHATLCPN